MPDNMARHIAEDSTVSILHKYRWETFKSSTTGKTVSVSVPTSQLSDS
jgi:hypothetical protein